MDERGQFTFYRSFWEAVKGLPKKDRLPILEAIISYALDGTEPTSLTQTQAGFFLLVKPNLDASRKKAASGKQGGSKPKATKKQTAREKEGEIEIEIEKEKENEIEGEIEKEEEKKRPESAPAFMREASEFSSPKPQDLHHPFTVFWEAYPKKIDREGAWEAWKALDPDPRLAEKIIQSLPAWKRSSQWTDDGGRFIPNAAKFLSLGYYEHRPKGPIGTQGASGELGEAELRNIRMIMAEHQNQEGST